MNGRLELMMHRWSSRLAIGGVVLAGLALVVLQVINDYSHPPTLEVIKLDRRVVSDSLRSTLAEVAQLLPTLNGNSRVQSAVASVVAGKDSNFVKELWVADEEGNIVYFGRHRPILPKIQALVSRNVLDVIDAVPVEVLPPIQRLSVIMAFAIRAAFDLSYDYYGHQIEGIVESSSLIEMHVTGSMLSEGRCVALQPIPGGLIAAVGYTEIWPPYKPGIMTTGIAFWRTVDGIVFGIGLAIYWFSLPLWVVTDARRRQEKAVAWGLFTLLGNVVALVLYLLVRREA